MSFFNNLFATTATSSSTTSAAATAQPHGNPIMSTVLMLLIFVVFIYFMLWRPQARRAKEHRNLMGALQPGDEVITSGGMLGKIAKIEDAYISLAIAENTEIKIQRAAISSLLPKGTIKS